MKRCPQCEFIYEDEQRTCDMDGAVLTLDGNSTTDQVKPFQLRSFAVPAIVGTLLAALLCLAVYVSPLLLANPDARGQLPDQTLPAGTPNPQPTVTQPAPEEPSPVPTPEVASDHRGAEEIATETRKVAETNHANSKPADSRLTIRRGLPPLPRVSTLPRLPPARVENRPVRDNRENDRVASRESKKPSKVGSFLKKTGRVISKPFKF